jgi:hypothetical protein
MSTETLFRGADRYTPLAGVINAPDVDVTDGPAAAAESKSTLLCVILSGWASHTYDPSC